MPPYLAAASGDLARLWPTAATRAEAAWLLGRAGQVADLVRETFQLAVAQGRPMGSRGPRALDVARRRAVCATA